MSNNRNNIYLPIYFSLTLIVGILLGIYMIPSLSRSTGIFSMKNDPAKKINDVIRYIEDDYVDTINRNSLTEKAITGLLHSLDPHSAYFSAADFNDANDPLMGNFQGIGVQFRVIKDSITVINVIKGGPSDLIGVKGGDRIIAINGKKSCNIKIKDEEVIKQLKGPEGSKVSVTVYRKTNKKQLVFSITRGVIPTKSIDIAYMVSPNIGYIKLSKFSATTIDEMDEAIKTLKNSGMTKLIFDLRGNGGGFLDAAVDIADEFLPDKKMIVYTEGTHRPRKSYYATPKGSLENCDLVIMIDEFTASASEIVSGAIQDNDRGTIIGRTSFGKGLVQEQVDLADGSAIRLTVARYHTPTGRCIQKSYTDGYTEYYEDFYNRLIDEDSDIIDSINLSATEKFKTPKGKIVYGGGGIMPDVYISYKTEYPQGYYRKLLKNNLINDFTFDYADKNRQTLLCYGSAGGFMKGFYVSQTLLNSFYEYAEKKGVSRDAAGEAEVSAMVSAQLKGGIGRNIFDDEAFYPVILPVDKVFEKAIRILNQ